MQAGATQPTAVTRDRRIIERPRLIKLLDETDARTILLLAPAGYGKTTLARQWARTLIGAVYLSLAPAHRDVAAFADDLARAINPESKDVRFIREYVRARSNPQREAWAIGRVLSRLLAKSRSQWIVLDDYHVVGDSEETVELIELLHQAPNIRFLVASRVRPSWATSRRLLYGDIAEIGRDDLAMTLIESEEVLGARADLPELLRQSEGWPAVLGLASRTGLIAPGGVMPVAVHDYFAEELFRSAREPVRERLMDWALSSDLSFESLRRQFGENTRGVVEEARELGFVSGELVELHPLIRDFLLQKVSERPNADEVVRKAIAGAVERGSWDYAFELIVRFKKLDLVEGVLEKAFRPLVRSGRLGTLSSFSTAVSQAPAFPPPVVDLIRAEVAHRDGRVDLASEISKRVLERLPSSHSLRSRPFAIIAQSSYINGDLKVAQMSYEQAHDAAQEESDKAEALYGWALALLQGELGNAEWTVTELKARSCHSPLDLLRHATAEIVRLRFTEGFANGIPVDGGMLVLPQVEDPRSRSSFTAMAAYCVALSGDYERGLQLIELAIDEVAAYDLDFALPHVWWTRAFIELGLRRFGTCERSLQRIEDASRDSPLGFHILNARALRARLALETGQLGLARELVAQPAREAAIPSIHGEYQATRALVFAATGERGAAFEAASEAESLSTAVEVRMLAQAARGLEAAERGNELPIREMWDHASSLGTWDPVIVAARTSPSMAAALASMTDLRPRLAELYQASHDQALLRQAGMRARVKRPPESILTPRELEVLELLARGFRNRDISQALVISPSTTKVHIRHILEKLGVRTRTEAVARFTSAPN